MTSPNRRPSANRLLAALPKSVVACCQPVELQFADVLCEPGSLIKHAYFPIDCFISVIASLDSGEKLEVGIIGAEGMFGESLVLGVTVAPYHALVLGAGTALRMNAATFALHFQKNLIFQKDMRSYVYVLMGQLALTTACSHYHDTLERLARWLLLTRDRAGSDQFRLTHELMAYMLGVRRVGITEAATELHKRGLIEYQRGEISILDGPGLEKAACSCYRQSQNLYDQLLSQKKMPARRTRVAQRALVNA